MAAIGVFICHCGSNISSTIDVEKVVEEVQTFPDVVCAVDYQFMCSSPGQDLLRNKIHEYNLTQIVIASCSPEMHLPTFRNAVRGDVNPYLVSMANIREQCSWVTADPQTATVKAVDLIRRQVRRAAEQQPLSDISVNMNKTALVIGGGIAGIQAALDIADGGHDVVLVEKESSIGGTMLRLDETFPTLDCSQCILTPKMVEAFQHPKIQIRVNSTVTAVDGYVGNFWVTIRKKATYVDADKCTGCGVCRNSCPSKTAPNEFNAGMDTTPAISIPSPQAVPPVPTINPDYCRMLTSGKCGLCQKVCSRGAIHFDDEPVETTMACGAIIAATGCREFSPEVYTEYGGGRYSDVITGMQFERLVSSTGPTGGELKRPSDGLVPKTIVFVQCVGSRDPARAHAYCSGICCMYTAKHSMLYKHKVRDGNAYVLYVDIRAPGKGYDEFVRRAIEEDDVRYIRGRAGRIARNKNRGYAVYAEDTLSGQQLTLDADMVVLACAIEPQADAALLAQTLGISYDGDGFYTEAHPKLKPVETATAGVYLAGTAQGPADIPTSVQRAGASASKVLSLFSSDCFSKSPEIARVDPTRCAGCYACQNVCHYSAIEQTEFANRNVLRVIQGKCQGCGSCVSACMSNAVTLLGYSDSELYEEVSI